MTAKQGDSSYLKNTSHKSYPLFFFIPQQKPWKALAVRDPALKGDGDHWLDCAVLFSCRVYWALRLSR